MFTKTVQGENKSQKPSYMQELNEWLDEEVIFKLSAAFEEYAAAGEAGVPQEEAAAKVNPVVDEVKKAIREKVLESYRNGQKAKGGSRQWGRGGRRYGSQ